MRTFIFANRLRLRNKFPSILAIIVCPTMYFRNFPGPVTMSRPYGRRPFQGSGTPGDLRGHFSSFENGIEKVKHKHQLNGEDDHRDGRYKPVQIGKLLKRGPTP